MMSRRISTSRLIAASVALALAAVSQAAAPKKLPPLQIQEQGSFMAGGKVVMNPGVFDPLKPTPEGQTFRGDHAYVFYQVPVNARKYPLVLWHGFGQFSKTWETTPDGREGYQNIFLRRRYGVYVLDQPRRGDASRSMVEATIKPVADEQNWFGVFRIGIWPNYFPGVQFSKDPQALDQYFRQMAPNIGPFDLDVVTDAAVQVLEKTGPAVLVTHSQGGGPGWITAIKTSKVRGIVAYEPGSNFPFPEGELPPAEPSSSGPVEPIAVKEPGLSGDDSTCLRKSNFLLDAWRSACFHSWHLRRRLRVLSPLPSGNSSNFRSRSGC